MALGQKQLLVLHAAARWKFKGLPKTTWGELIDQLQSAGHYVVLKRIRPATIA